MFQTLAKGETMPAIIEAPAPFLRTVLTVLFDLEQHLENGTPLNTTLDSVTTLASGLNCALLDAGQHATQVED
jgi:hypothetical protein